LARARARARAMAGLGLWLRLGLRLGVGAAGPTGPTSRRARVSEPTRVTRPSNPRLLANPSHRRKRLLIYRRCRYLFIFSVTYLLSSLLYILCSRWPPKKGRAGSGSDPKRAV